MTSKSAPIGLYIIFQGKPDYMKKVHTTSTILKYTADTLGTTEPLNIFLQSMFNEKLPTHKSGATNDALVGIYRRERTRDVYHGRMRELLCSQY